MSYRADKLGDGRTDGQTQATTIPEGQNWPRVKMHICHETQVLHLLSNDEQHDILQVNMTNSHI